MWSYMDSMTVQMGADLRDYQVKRQHLKEEGRWSQARVGRGAESDLPHKGERPVNTGYMRSLHTVRKFPL